MARRQNTIGKAVSVSGRALFSGRETVARLCPAETHTGILFVRTDLPDKPVVPATTEALGSGLRWTTLQREEVEIRSVEHLLSACLALRVDNLMVELDGDEMPAGGGCAGPYAEALLEGGIEEQAADKPTLEIEQPFVVSEGEAYVMAMPAEEGLTLNYVLEFDQEGLATQVITLRLEPEIYLTDFAPARTFAFENAYEEFARQGIGGGVTDDNALVIFRDGSIRKAVSRQKAELRFPDEFVRHKMVDLLGDLALAGVEVQGKVVALRSGHKLHSAFAARLASMQKEKVAAAEEYLDIREIQRVLPHRYPFLFVDRILRIEGDTKIVGVKNVSANEPFFQGHYPDYPIMPGVLQLEALAQVAGVLLLQKLEHAGKVAMVVSMDGVRLRRPVQPGDQLILEAQVVRLRTRTAQVNARGMVNGQVCCEAEMTFMLVDAEVL